MLLRLAYLGVTYVFAMLRLLPMSDHGKDVEILALRHQLMVLERQLGEDRVRFTPGDRVFLAALLHRLPRNVLRRVRLLVRPDTVLRRHRDLLARRHAACSLPKRPGRPRTVRSVRVLVLRLARENPGWGYRRTWFVRGDIIRVQRDDDGVLWAGETVRASQNCTIRLIVLKDDGSAAARQSVLEAFHRLGTTGEGIEQFRMVALDVPPQADLPKIRELLEHGETKEWWHWEEGCVTAAWEAAARS